MTNNKLYNLFFPVRRHISLTASNAPLAHSFLMETFANSAVRQKSLWHPTAKVPLPLHFRITFALSCTQQIKQLIKSIRKIRKRMKLNQPFYIPQLGKNYSQNNFLYEIFLQLLAHKMSVNTKRFWFFA